MDAAPATGGMFLWGRVAVRTRPLLARALRAGVAFVPGDAFGVDTDHAQWLRLSFATLPVAELRTAARPAPAGGGSRGRCGAAGTLTRMSRALVTGATGFVGRALTRRLLAGGWSVAALVRRADAELPPGVEALRVPDTDPTSSSSSRRRPPRTASTSPPSSAACTRWPTSPR